MNWKERLIKEIKTKPICKDGFGETFDLESKEQAIDYYKRTIDWSLENSYPSLELLREEFSEFEHKGLYINKEFKGEVLSAHKYYVLIGCTGFVNIEFNLHEVINPILYLSNNCNLIIEGKPINSPMAVKYHIYSFGENTAKTVNIDNVTYRIHKKQIL